MQVIAIAVVGSNGVIGDGADQPFKFAEDWARFKRVTTGHPLIIGRRTHDAMGLLPGRTSIVITRNPSAVGRPHTMPKGSGLIVVGSVEEALAAARTIEDERVYIGGGGEIYRLAWPHTTALDLTEVPQVAAGDVRFPEVAAQEWRELTREPRGDFDFVHYAPITRTERLVLEPVTEADLDDWSTLHTDPELYLHSPAARLSEPDQVRRAVRAVAGTWLAHGLGYWLVRDHSGALLGAGGVTRFDDEEPWNLYYRFTKPAQGQGLALELARAAVKQLRRLDPGASIQACTRDTNQPAARVAERLGLARRPDRVEQDGTPLRVYRRAVADLAV